MFLQLRLDDQVKPKKTKQIFSKFNILKRELGILCLGKIAEGS